MPPAPCSDTNNVRHKGKGSHPNEDAGEIGHLIDPSFHGRGADPHEREDELAEYIGKQRRRVVANDERSSTKANVHRGCVMASSTPLRRDGGRSTVVRTLQRRHSLAYQNRPG